MAAPVEQWQLKVERQIASTATSDVFLVSQRDNQPAVLKVLTSTGKSDEINASIILEWYQGHGSVNLIHHNADALLIEYAEGRSLADMVFAGRDNEATAIACNIVKKLHSGRAVSLASRLPALDQRFSDLFTAAEKSKNALVREAAQVATALLETTRREVPLHGDLHHHNIIHSNRGWLTIDPKGLTGDPAYEVSNLFANPLNAHTLCTQPERTRHLLDICTSILGYEKERIARFAFVHNVLATIWAGTVDEPDQTSLEVATNIRQHF
ncbi:hypothetical protein AB833_13195 [Chromatiales bacterium (ex Bugula neritina AB1)]|nr:hypothetical protein AB833_13195 [Chromatiales bacterium (ex Bugula neritina AB1)]